MKVYIIEFIYIYLLYCMSLNSFGIKTQSVNIPKCRVHFFNPVSFIYERNIHNYISLLFAEIMWKLTT